MNIFGQITDQLLAALDTRSCDVIVRRFGIRREAETLESIGREYGITRERVRQIEAQAKRTLSRIAPTYKPIEETLKHLFDTHGGMITEPHLLALLHHQASGTPQLNTVRLYLEIIQGFEFVLRHPVFRPHWKTQGAMTDTMENIIEQATQALSAAGKPMPKERLLNTIRSRLTTPVPQEHIESALMLARAIEKTAFSDWGLGEWAEVSPRGVADKAYAVLRRHGKPGHFREITELINRARFDGKQANPQTVHNELIKDQRFVLVGRGMYGLREWGFTPGTVADVMETVLREARHPLSREELVERVMQQRIVKKNTILLGLQNSQRFTKTANDTYTVRL